MKGIIAFLVVGLMIMAACGGEEIVPGPNTAPAPTAATAVPTVPPDYIPGAKVGAKIIIKTVPEFLSEVLSNPKKYTETTVVRVSGVVVKREEDLAKLYVYLGPAVRDYYVVAITFKYGPGWNGLDGLKPGNKVQIEGRYFPLINHEYKRVKLLFSQLVER